MAAAPDKLASLRHLLAERFPTLPRSAGRVFPTGLPALDEAAGGLPLGAVTELVCAAPSCGGQLFVDQLLATTRQSLWRVALIDHADSFDPSSYSADRLAHLVWVRCHPSAALAAKVTATSEALAAADLLARDANLGLVLLDLRRAPDAELRRIPATAWYRLQRAVEPTDLALLVVTPRIAVPSAQLRFVLGTSHPPAAFATARHALAAALAPALQRRRLQVATA